jgi:perosamine synthetase
MVVTRDQHIANQIRSMRNQGRYNSDAWHQHSILGWNYRLSEINCALGCAQMRRVDHILSSREAVARTYDEALRCIEGIELPPLQLVRRQISWFVYVVRLAPRFSQQDRDAIARNMADQGIACGRYFAPIHTQPAYDLSITHSLPVTEAISVRTLALPFFNRLDKERILRVTEILGSAMSTLKHGEGDLLNKQRLLRKRHFRT